MAHLHRLHRLSFAAVGGSPQHPVVLIADGIAGIPEFVGDSLINRILVHFPLLAILDFPGRLAGELKIQTQLVDAPALGGF